MTDQHQPLHRVDRAHAGAVVDASGIATLTITNAESANVLDTPVIGDLTAALAELAAPADLRVLALRSTGDKAFVAGADIREMAALDQASAEAFIDGLRGLCEAVRLFPVPAICRIPGWALGGALELAMACDLRISSETARFGMPEHTARFAGFGPAVLRQQKRLLREWEGQSVVEAA